MILEMNVTFTAGGFVVDRFREAVELASEYNCSVKFSLNGVSFNTALHPTVEDMLEHYELTIGEK